MITWMQRHKKYLIVTIWISTIAFVGAGFVGWGQYSYGDKAGSVAKVGEIEISMGDLQKSYSNLYNQYNQMFQGNFDEEKAKSFGLQAQALKQLTDQALILNLANEYDLKISDKELLDEIKTQEYFFENGVFSKEIYKQMLSRNNLSLKEYEADVKKQLLIQKVLKLLPVDATANERSILNTLSSIADKIEYKVLDASKISVDTSDKLVKPFWEMKQHNFMTEVSYDIKYIKQANVTNKYSEEELKKYYNENKTHFKDNDGKIVAFEKAVKDVEKELNQKATKDSALRTYIAYKKGKLDPEVKVSTATISSSNNPFDEESLDQISKLSVLSPFMKPVLVNGTYYTFELLNTNPSVAKTYEQAKKDVLPLYVSEQKKSKLLDLAQKTLPSFKGSKTDFITSIDSDKLSKMNSTDANDFLAKLFEQQSKKGYITLDSGKIVLYNILEQKLLKKDNNNQDDSIIRLKSSMFSDGLISKLRQEYKTEIFIQGL